MNVLNVAGNYDEFRKALFKVIIIGSRLMEHKFTSAVNVGFEISGQILLANAGLKSIVKTGEYCLISVLLLILISIFAYLVKNWSIN